MIDTSPPSSKSSYIITRMTSQLFLLHDAGHTQCLVICCGGECNMIGLSDASKEWCHFYIWPLPQPPHNVILFRLARPFRFVSIIRQLFKLSFVLFTISFLIILSPFSISQNYPIFIVHVCRFQDSICIFVLELLTVMNWI